MKKQKNILLIDLHFRAIELINQGFSLYDCANITDAVVVILDQIKKKKHLPDVILINVYRMEFSEIDWFNNILINSQLNIPIIIMDLYYEDHKIKKFRKIGMSDYLHEKCTLETLLLQINRTTADVPKLRPQKQQQYGISWIKRTMDVLGASLLLMGLSPLLLIVMIALKLESTGPIFYWQYRVGAGYKIFKIFKFRSMKIGADKLLDAMAGNNHYRAKDQKKKEKNHSSTMLVGDALLIEEDAFMRKLTQEQSQSFKKFKNDPRITKLGHWIRKTSIDELPQLANVLRGDMSLVGNRPLPLYEAETLTSDEWTGRFMAPAGLTGLWQVSERKTRDTSAASRKKLDIEYAQNHDLFMDLNILFKTPLAAIQKEKI